MTTMQHVEAEKLLPIIVSAATTHKLLTYGTAAKELGRDPKTNSRMVAQVCDLLDAAAAYAGVPLLALVTVREISGNINRKAWTGSEEETGLRDAIIEASLQHKFSQLDFLAISEALKTLDGKSNKAAWKYVRESIPSGQLYSQLTKLGSLDNADAIDDIGTDFPARMNVSTVAYARDPKVRSAVRLRAAGKCEFCGEVGFICSDGTNYLECHHIIALAKDGADRMHNVIALCPADHREAHFGMKRLELEKEMIRKVRIAERLAGRMEDRPT